MLCKGKDIAGIAVFLVCFSESKRKAHKEVKREDVGEKKSFQISIFKRAHQHIKN
jgi:hypothetical protein